MEAVVCLCCDYLYSTLDKLSAVHSRLMGASDRTSTRIFLHVRYLQDTRLYVCFKFRMHRSNIKNVAKPYHPFDIIAIHRFRNRFPGQILTNFGYILTNFDEILTNADFLLRTLISNNLLTNNSPRTSREFVDKMTNQ